MAKNIEIDLIINTAGSEKSVAQAKQAIRELNNELKRLGPEADDAFVNKVNSAIGQTKAQLADLQDEINNVRPDRIGQAFLTVGQSIAGAFQVVEGAFAAFGGESQKLQEVQTRLLAISNVAAGLGNLKETTEDFGRAFKVVNNVIKQNPLILLVGIFVALSSKSKTFQNIIELLGVSFEILGAAVDGVVSIFSDFIDGLTGAGAASDNLDTKNAQLTASNNALKASYDRLNQSLANNNADLEFSNALLAAQGADQGKILNNTIKGLEAQNAEIETFLKNNFVLSQQNPELKKQLDELSATYDNNSNKLRIVRAELQTFNKEQDKAASEERTRKQQEGLQKLEQYQNQLENLRRQFVLTERERINAEFDDKIKQIKGGSAEELEILANLELARTEALNEFDKKAEEDRKAKEQKRLDDAKAAAEKLSEATQQGIENQLTRLDLDGQLTRDKALELEKKKFDDLIALNKDNQLEVERLQLEFRTRSLEINKDFDEKEKAQAELAAEQQRATRQAVFDSISTGLNIITQLGDAFIKDERKRIKFERNAAIAQIALNTATSIAGLVDGATKAASATGPAFPITFAAVLAGGLTAIFTTIKKANDQLKAADQTGLTSGGGTNTGGVNLATLGTGSQNATPQANLQQLGAFTQNEQGQFQVFVSETDITSVVNRVQVIESRASFG